MSGQEGKARRVRLRKESRHPWESVWTVLTDSGRNLGTVHRERSHKARKVKGVGGVTRWVATLPDGTVVTPWNAYRRVDAVDALVAHTLGDDRG